MNQLYLPETLRVHFGAEPFTEIMQLQGKVFRDVKGRKTIQITIGSKSYFVKQHFGIGWGEIFKSYLSFKMPVLGAMTEVQAIKKLDKIGIPTTPLVAYGVRGGNPATRQSFVITQDLGEIVQLDDWFAGEKHADTAFRSTVIAAVAQIAKTLHGAGCCHRDFYLCHFVAKKIELEQGKLNLYLIDLHRMLQGQSPNGNAVMKDIAGLKFSFLQIGLTHEDFEFFKQHYMPQSEAFWRKVEPRVVRLLAKFFSKKFQKRLASEKAKTH